MPPKKRPLEMDALPVPREWVPSAWFKAYNAADSQLYNAGGRDWTVSKRKRDSGETRERALKLWGKYPANKALRTRKEREEMAADTDDDEEEEVEEETDAEDDEMEEAKKEEKHEQEDGEEEHDGDERIHGAGKEGEEEEESGEEDADGVGDEGEESDELTDADARCEDGYTSYGSIFGFAQTSSYEN